MIDLFRDIKAPFRCGELFIAFLQEYIDDELGFLILARQDNLFSRLLLDLVLPILNIFVDFLESSMKDHVVSGSKKEYAQSRQFLLGSLITIQYLLDKNEDVLATSIAMIEPRLLTLQKYCFDSLAKCYFTQLLPILDGYKIFK